VWWLTFFIVLIVLTLGELTFVAVRRNLVIRGQWKWPPWKRERLDGNVEEWDLGLWQEVERDPIMRENLKRMARDDSVNEDGHLDETLNEEVDLQRV
jgi:phospholipid-translocating ATPase